MRAYEQRLENARTTYEILLASKVYSFDSVTPSSLPEVEGIYVIWLKDTEEALYVGRTKNIRQRLYTNHLMGNKSSARLKKYIVDDNDNYPEINNYAKAKLFIKENCCFQFITEEENNLRGHKEGLLGYLSNCRYIEKEH